MSSYNFRLNVSYDVFKSHYSQIFEEFSHFAIYEHEADEEVSRNHLHGVCEGCVVKSPKTLRSRFAKTFNLGNGDYMVGVGVGDKPFEYMSKGRLEPLLLVGYEKAYVDARKVEGFDKKKDKLKVKDGKIVIERDVKEQKPRTDLEMILEISKRCDTNGWTDTREVAHEIVRTWKKYNKRGHTTLLQQWIDAVKYNGRQCDAWIDAVVENYEKRFR